MSTLEIRVDYFNPISHALRSDGHPAWPPDPLRLQAALLAGAHQPTLDSEAREAVVALGSLPPPTIYTPEHSVDLLPPTYAPRSGSPVVGSTGASARALEKYVDGQVAGISSVHRVLKPTAGVVLADCTIVYLVEDPNTSVDVAALDRAARRVPYFGRSHDQCDISVGLSGEPLPPIDWHPIPTASGRYRGWTASSVEWMDANHELMSSGSELPPLHWGPYSAPLDYQPAVDPSAIDDAVPTAAPQAMRIVPLRKPMPQGRAWKLLDPLETHADVLRFPCVVAGFSNADGGVRGFGLAGDSTQVARTEPELRQLLGHAAAGPDSVTTMRTLDPAYWQSTSNSWVSATPLRAFPDERVATYVILKELDELGLGDARLLLERKTSRRWQHATAQPADGLDLWWATLELAHPMTGPLMLGASQHAGFGLFVPQEQR